MKAKRLLADLLAFLILLEIMPVSIAVYEKHSKSQNVSKCTFLFGNTFFFGLYEQDGDTLNGKEPIEWLILDIQEDRALLVSTYSLNCRRYNYYDEETSWEKCTLREWLNESFFKECFTAEEKKQILTTELTADDNLSHSTDQNSIKDKIFLLSISEAEGYFDDDTERTCEPSVYAAQKNWHSYDPKCWWLRSSGQEGNYAVYVHQHGDIDAYGCNVSAARGVRPALWLDLSYLLEIYLDTSWRYI